MEPVETKFAIPPIAEMDATAMRRRRAIQLCRIALRDSDYPGDNDLGDRIAAILTRLDAVGQWRHSGRKIDRAARTAQCLPLDDNEERLVQILRDAFNQIDLDFPATALKPV
jgi:hypothetical protein